MKKQKVTDERILAQKRKIGSDAFQIIFLGLLASILIQQYFLKAPFSQYAVEFIFMVTGSVYVVLRNFVEGNDSCNSGKGASKLLVINSLICGLTIAVVNAVLHYVAFGEVLSVVLFIVITFFAATISSFVVLKLLQLVNKKRQKNIEAHLNEDEE